MAIKSKINEQKTCKRCGDKIHSDDKFVLLGTYQEKVLDESFFHYRCYIDWINEKIREHSTKQIQESMNLSMQNVKPMLEKLKGFMDG